jgi:prepilin peptidase CpaA
MFITITLIIILTIAAVTDLQHRKIPNAVTIPAMLYGLICHTYLNGLDGFLFSVMGTVVGLGLLLLFYINNGMMGAGDVKLMGAVGSILGPLGVFKAFLFTAVVGGIYALIVFAIRGQFIRFLKRIILSLNLTLMIRRLTLVPDEEKASPVLCYGIAIGVGTSISLLLT